MRTFRYLCFPILVLLLVTTACAQRHTATADDTLRADIGQMLLVGFRGTAVDENSTIVRDIRDYHIGGVILFEYDATTGKHHRNVASPKQLRQLTTQLQKWSKEPLWISVDQEGGRVARLKVSDGFAVATPSPKQMAAGGTDTVRYHASRTAAMLHDMGVNLNFAPCADVDVNPDCPVIGRLGRSFSADASAVTDCCAAWLDGQSQEGVVGCLKHFPGHGSASGDTHAGLVDVTDSWQERELAPYRTLIAQGKVPMVMMAHIVNRNIDNKYPASLSRRCVDLLRDKLGFQGVVVTDDMAMGAIVNQYGYNEAVALALEAGVDMLCLGNNGTSYNADIVPQTVDIILQLVRDGRVTAERIHQSAERIRTAKKQIGSNKKPVTGTKGLKSKN